MPSVAASLGIMVPEAVAIIPETQEWEAVEDRPAMCGTDVVIL